MNFFIDTSDIAQAEIEAIYLQLLAYDPDFAGRWLVGLNRAIASLETFPRRNERVSKRVRRDVKPGGSSTKTAVLRIGLFTSSQTRMGMARKKLSAFFKSGKAHDYFWAAESEGCNDS